MRKSVLLAISLAYLGGYPIFVSAQDNVTVVMNDGRERSNSISGVILSAEDNEPLVGAQVRIVGANVATITDVNGRFSFQTVALKNQKLTVSYIGMETQSVDAGHNMKIVLKPNSKTLSDVVVNGFFTRKKQTFTGAARTVTSDEILKVAPNNIMQTLATLDPSLNITQNNAMGSNPNAVPDLVIRSTTSLSTSNEVGLNAPLIVIDGVEQSLQALYDMDINDIERVDILKDASATALYGENAANGVIVIERKRVSQSPVRIRYTFTPEASFADLSSYDYCDAAQKLELERLAGLYKSTTGSLDKSYYEKLALVNSGVNTDWMSKPVRNSFSHSHSLSISGRGSGLDYNVNANYQDTEGVMKDDGRKRYGMNIYLSYTAVKDLIVTLRASHDQLNTNASKFGKFSNYLACNPYDSPYDEYGNLRSSLSYNMDNPLYEASLSSFNKSQTRTQQISLDLRYNILPTFFVTAQGSYSTSRGTSDAFTSPDSHEFETVAIKQKGRYELGNTSADQWAGKIVANYIHNFDKDGTMLTLNLGGEIKKNKSTASSLVGTGFLSDNQNDMAYATAYPNGGQPSGSEDLSTSLGGFLAANFMWKNRYVVDGSYRVSGSSKFGSDHRYAPFWSVGAGWNLHNEKFIKEGLKGLGITYLKLRASIGNPGNQNFSSSATLTTFRYNFNSFNYFGMTTSLAQLGNPNLEWQTTIDRNVGFDITILNDRLKLVGDYYYKTTDPLLITIDMPASSGATGNQIYKNFGKQTSKGFTGQATYYLIRHIKDRLWWNVRGTLRTGTTKLSGIGTKLESFNSKEREGANRSTKRYYDGASTDDIWVVRSAGIDPATGREIFIKKNGELTYDFSYDDEVIVGNSRPTIEGVLGSSFSWKGLSVSADFRYRVGGYSFNSVLFNKVENISTGSLIYNQDKRALYDRWQKPGDRAQFKDIANSVSTPMSSRFVQRDNSWSLESLRVGYEFSPELARRFGMSSIRLNAYMNDIFRLTTIKQERGTSYPYARSVSFALSLTL